MEGAGGRMVRVICGPSIKLNIVSAAVSEWACVGFCSPRLVEGGGWRTEKYNSFSLLSVYAMLSHRRPRPQPWPTRRAAPLAKMNGFQRGLDSHPLYALDARSLARATPSLPRQAIYTLHVPSGGLHYRSDTTQSCKVEAAAAAGKSN